MIGIGDRPPTPGWVKPAGTAAVGLCCAGVLTQLTYPLIEGRGRDLVTIAVVLLLASACVVHAAATRGPRWASGLLVITAGGGLAAEFVGTATGFPFGQYTYTAGGALGPELGSVPLLIGPAWTFGAYPAWCAAQALAGSRRVETMLVATWGLASWDLYLDPQMVADGRWVWTDPGPGLPGVSEVPLTNYAGWLLVALVFSLALSSLDRALPPSHGSTASQAGASSLDTLPLVLFCWTWLGSALAHALFLGLPASAGYGLVAMGLVGAPLLVKMMLSGRARPWGGFGTMESPRS